MTMKKTALTPEEFTSKMKEIYDDTDKTTLDEEEHSAMIELMVKQLKSLGYDKGIKYYTKMNRYYS
jgi:hypothetical protein